MLTKIRTALMISTAATVAASVVLGAGLIYGIDPVRFSWVTRTETGSYATACDPHILPSPIYSRTALAKFAARPSWN